MNETRGGVWGDFFIALLIAGGSGVCNSLLEIRGRTGVLIDLLAVSGDGFLTFLVETRGEGVLIVSGSDLSRSVLERQVEVAVVYEMSIVLFVSSNFCEWSESD